MDTISIEILKDLFLKSLANPQGIDSKKFRVDHKSHLQLIENLVRQNYIDRQDWLYRPKLVSVILLADSVPSAKSILDDGEALFGILREHYEKNFDEPISLKSLAAASGIQRNDINNALRYMVDTPVLMSRSAGFPEDESAVVSVGEAVIEPGSYRDVLAGIMARQQQWDVSTNVMQPGAFLNSLQEENQPFGYSGLEGLLHERVVEVSLRHFNNGEFEVAVLRSIIAISDLLRRRTGIDTDGDNLVNNVFSLGRPLLVLGDLTSESGRNDQLGFMDMLKGFYKGVRNPRAHSLEHDLTRLEAARYLVLASLFMGRIEAATLIDRASV